MSDLTESRERTRTRILIDIIETCRRATSAPKLSEEEAGKTSLAWDEILRDVPTPELRKCYQLAMTERTVRGAFLPQEILAIWKTIRRPKALDPASPDCALCEGTGYQKSEIYCPTSRTTREPVRPCGCAIAPESQKRVPLRPPEWERREKDRVWVAATGNGFVCTCLRCEKASKFSRSDLRWDARDITKPPYVA